MMKTKKIILTALLSILFAFTANAQKEGTRVYAFGYAISFADSVVTLSAIQNLEEAQLMPKSGFLRGASLYSTQLRNFLIENQGGIPVCTIFYNTNRKQLEKKYAQLRKRVKKEGINNLKELSTGDFSFKPVSHESIQ